jgi:hypothetical protein
MRSYAGALEAYRAQRWSEAERLLAETLHRRPHDGPAQVLMERCKLFAAQPPPEDWDGVFEATHK